MIGRCVNGGIVERQLARSCTDKCLRSRTSAGVWKAVLRAHRDFISGTELINKVCHRDFGAWLTPRFDGLVNIPAALVASPLA